MKQFKILDTPIANPENDLLNVIGYARKLADFIRCVDSPFTVGIYGEWGEGKTSFVHFLEHYLKHPEPEVNYDGKPIVFITFSAWPHTTADTLWRGLVLKIAQCLYDVPDSALAKESQPPKPTSLATGLWGALVHFLRSDALILRKPPPAPEPHADYNAFVAKIDRTTCGSISKSPDEHVQVNQEMAMMALVKTGVTALGTMSPLVAGIRSLLSLDTGINLSEMLYKEKNAAVRDTIQTVHEFRHVFREIFAKKAEGKRVFVFIDDLDRCMPDVALDLLEAVKIFFDEVVCVFIVAADESLIGKGLRMRYKELRDERTSEDLQKYFAQKGKEYFEKIIQLSIRVPPRTLEQTHTFISGQFPYWMPATDIIQIAIGNNPRRLKQYCNWLTYKRMVAEVEQPDGASKE